MQRPPLLPTLALAITLALALVAAGSLWWPGGTPAELRGIALNEPRPLPAFRLDQGEGGTLERDDLRGGWHFVYFGYTHCPDVCPATLARLGDLAARLPADGPGLLFVSVDPDRDTPQRLATYTDYFHPRLRGVTGSRAAIDRLVDGAGAHYRLGEGADYTVDHSAGVFLVGPDARVHAVLPPPHRPREMADRFRAVREHAQQGRWWEILALPGTAD